MTTLQNTPDPEATGLQIEFHAEDQRGQEPNQSGTNIPLQRPAALPLPDPACGQHRGSPAGNAGRGIRMVVATF